MIADYSQTGLVVARIVVVPKVIEAREWCEFFKC
jgi:hypothetical protein